jgi:hypothetical protein
VSETTETQAKDVELHKPRKSALGLIVKYILLSLVDSIGGYAVYLMAVAGLWIPAAVLVLSLVGINWLYLTERAVPLKYLLPGTITMAIFAVLPIIYTVYIAFTNYSTGHVLSKEEAITAIANEGYTDYDAFTVQVADDASGKRVYLLERFDVDGNAVGSYVADENGLTEQTERFVLNDANQYEPIPPAGYTAVDAAEVDKWLAAGKAFRVPVSDIRYIQLDTGYIAYEREQRWVYELRQCVQGQWSRQLRWPRVRVQRTIRARKGLDGRRRLRELRKGVQQPSLLRANGPRLYLDRGLRLQFSLLDLHYWHARCIPIQRSHDAWPQALPRPLDHPVRSSWLLVAARVAWFAQPRVGCG